MTKSQVPGTVAALSLSTLLASLGTSIANIALPTLAQEFAAPFPKVQWVVIAYLLAVTAFIVIAGRIADRMGRRRMLLIGLSLFTLGAVLAGVSPDIEALILSRVVQGVGAATMMALTLALVTGSVPPHKIGRAMGLLGTTSAVGTALGPTLGGVLIANFGWRAIFLAQAPLGGAALLLTLRHIAVDSERSVGRRAPWRRPFPLVPFGKLANPTLRSGLTMSGLASTVLMATLVVGPFYLSRTLGLGAAHAGLAMSVGPLVAALAGVPSGKLVDQWGPDRGCAIGLSGVILGCTALALVPSSLGISGYLLPLGVITAGYALFQTANNTSVMKSAPHEERGLTSGLLNLSRNLGLIAGASAMGTLFARSSGVTDITNAAPQAAARGMHSTFAVASLLGGVALGFQLLKRSSSSTERDLPGLSGWDSRSRGSENR